MTTSDGRPESHLALKGKVHNTLDSAQLAKIKLSGTETFPEGESQVFDPVELAAPQGMSEPGTKAIFYQRSRYPNP